jgi:hypothetical protein
MLKKIAATPYGARESIGWLVRNITGLSGRNKRSVAALSSPHVFNDGVKPKYRLAAIGDIARMTGHRLEIEASLGKFIGDSDYIIGDFEGTITGARRPRWPIAFDQRHDARIIEDVAKFLPPGRTFLSVANNHAGDFGRDEYFKSVDILVSRGYHVFGTRDKPFADVTGDLRLIAGTMWSNRDCDYVAQLEDAESHIRKGAFNLLYPHMGFELEHYPRPEIVRFAREAVTRFDAVVCHHPHCPQPVTAEKVGAENRLIAYSLGDFCFCVRPDIYRFGLVLKMEIGPSLSGRLVAGKAEWLRTECARTAHGQFTVRPVR